MNWIKNLTTKQRNKFQFLISVLFYILYHITLWRNCVWKSDLYFAGFTHILILFPLSLKSRYKLINYLVLLKSKKWQLISEEAETFCSSPLSAITFCFVYKLHRFLFIAGQTIILGKLPKPRVGAPAVRGKQGKWYNVLY